MQDLLLITVDCDLRCDDVDLRQESLDILLQVFDEVGAAGHITWFLNENDFEITNNHESFLREALRRGDTLGLHDHIDWLDGRWEFEPISEYCRNSKKTVETWLAQNGYGDKVVYHRAGCLFQHPIEYAAIKKLGYTVISDVWPGNTRPNHTGHLAFDNRKLPVGIMPYRHDEGNFLDYTSRQGYFLHIPIMHMGLADLNFDIMGQWLEAFRNNSIEPGMLVWLFHPYEILKDKRTVLSPELVQILKAHIDKCCTEFAVNFANIEESLAQIERR